MPAESELPPVLVVLSAGQSEYRESMVARIAGRYRLTLVSPEPVTWEKPYIIDHVVVDPADSAGFVSAALRFARTYPVIGVFTHDEWCVEKAAAIGAALGVAQVSPAAAARCRDKWACRETFRMANVPSARSELVSDVARAQEAADRIGYPVVVKPRALSASFAVRRAADPDQVAEAFQRAWASHPKRAWEHVPGVLVEEYLDGDEISVDSAAYSGHVETVVYARKLLGYPPYFEEVGHIVAAPEVLVPDPSVVAEVVRAAHKALGIDNAVTHTEIRLTEQGPRIVEVNARLGGGLIPELGLAARGIDLAAATADIAAGRGACLRPTKELVAGIRFFYADSAGTVVSRELDPDLPIAPWIRSLTWLLKPGARVIPEPGRRYFARAGFAIVTAESVPECEERMRTLAEHAVIRIR
jgi:carbamoylphosphate synthase large subunit